ncbi:hypothetical protein FRAHR75_1060010 [Frankia sp. Hr75.2]|nr:hypothetical protein FRAHR75_1060010 [Frankia sp. Hr75.2]
MCSTEGVEHRMTVRALRCTVQRIQMLTAEALELGGKSTCSSRRGWRPSCGRWSVVGPISAAQVLVSWSHPGRFRFDVAFAAFADGAPISASSGPL